MTVFVTQEIKKLPELHIKWVRDTDTIDYNRPNTYLCVGMRGTGKSSMLETLAVRYPKIIDLFGSKDNESLAWCKPESPYKKILLVTGDNINVNSQYPTINVKELTLKEIEKHQVITTCHAFYNTKSEYFVAIQEITTMLCDKRVYWDEPWALVIRESANYIYSRLQIVKDSNMAKADFIALLREARHSGIAVLVDTIRWTSIDKEVRDVSDYMFFKRVGAIGLPKDLSFIYRYVNPRSMMKLWKNVFVLLTGTGAIAIGKFDKPAWHKEENENILYKLNIDITYLDKDRIQQGPNVSPSEHALIMRTYSELKSMGKVAAKLSRSKSTIQEAVKRHNNTIGEIGYCLECYNSKEPLASVAIKCKREHTD
jgi:hypothetical protein